MSAKMTTTDGRPVEVVRAEQQAEGNKLHASYIVLTDEERAKGFVRPYRASYKHVGPAGPSNPLEDLSPEDSVRYEKYGYVKHEPYPKNDNGIAGRFWTQAQLDAVNRGCGAITTMAQRIAETYSANPQFYGSTFCSNCGKHFPVGPSGEFVWSGTNERVGT